MAKIWLHCIRFCIRIFNIVMHFVSDVTFDLLYGWRSCTKLPPIGSQFLQLPAVKIADMIRRQEVTCREVMEAFISRIREVNPIINAVVFDRFECALTEADDLDAALQADPLAERWRPEFAPLLGVPISVKEAFSVRGCPNTSGLTGRSHLVADTDADAVSRLRAAGGLPLCLTNTSELCMWWESANHVYGRTGNPYDPRRTVGGSSGGEGALIGSGGSVVGVGSDIGGSIRMPAHFNGVFGHKATRCMVSNAGQFPSAEGHAVNYMLTGPICRYASDLVPLLGIMAGKENSKLMHLDELVDVSQLRVYYAEDIGDRVFTSPVEPDIRNRLVAVTHHFSSLGCHVEKLSPPYLRHAFQLWSAKMSTAEQQSFCELLGNGGPACHPVKELGRWCLGRSRHTLPAIGLGLVEKVCFSMESTNHNLCRLCDRLADNLEHLLEGEAVFLLPTHPTTAPYHHQPLFRWANFAYTGIFNVIGLPATSAPMGLDRRGLPMGLQIVGGMGHDHMTLAVAREVERRFGGWIDPSRTS